MWRRLLVGVMLAVPVLAPALSAQARGEPDVLPLFASVFGTRILGPAGGDQDSRGALSMVTPKPDRVCFGLNVLGMAEVTSVEVRQGADDETGPVRLELTPLPSSGEPASGCVSGVAPSLISDIRAHPDEYYLNVATTEFPQGAARGQFFGTPTGGGVDWFIYAAGAAIFIVVGALGFLAGRRGSRRPTFTA